ncbi:hypothetical protein F5Y08DRAFT_353521 [Xylaria arbuscula]|nr:hypothetical protein F5Y08DRAFT_353521 [Xylaria arbuscula]
MTLDQYYYPTIDDTSKRDKDQVLSKFLEKDEAISETNDSKESHRTILKVNHLWIWILDNKTIITATTDDSSQDQHPRNSAERQPSRSLLEAASRHIEDLDNFEGTPSAYTVMETIVAIATRGFVEKSVSIPGQLSKGPIEIFRESLRDVANRENSLFRSFLGGLRKEAGGEQKRRQNDEEEDEGGTELAPPTRSHVISSETELLDAIRDIRDELQMLKSLAEDQKVVWRQAFGPDHSRMKSNGIEYRTPSDVMKELDEMLSESDRIENYVNTLLDLRLAEFGRLQAYDSARQSNIFFLFTVITIVFLPLSFLSSLFALDVSVFPHDAGELKYQGWWIFPILFGVTTIVSVPAIILAWNVNAISDKLKPRQNLESDDAVLQKGIAMGCSMLGFRGKDRQRDSEHGTATPEIDRPMRRRKL